MSAYPGVERRQNAGLADDVVEAKRGKHHEVDGHNRPKHGSDACGPPSLCCKERDQDGALIGSTMPLNPGWITVRPSTAERTDMAGVMIASP
jgi:hypothetical protein